VSFRSGAGLHDPVIKISEFSEKTGMTAAKSEKFKEGVISSLKEIHDLGTDRPCRPEICFVAFYSKGYFRIHRYVEKIQDLFCHCFLIPDKILEKDKFHIFSGKIPKIFFNAVCIVSLGKAKVFQPLFHDLFPAPGIQEHRADIRVKGCSMSSFFVISHYGHWKKAQSQKIFISGITPVCRIPHHKDQLCIRRKIFSQPSGASP